MGLLLNLQNHSYVVKEAFMHLFDNGLIRRGEGLVNWSFALQSSVADIEVDQVEFNGRTRFKIPGYSDTVEFGLLYHCAYPVQNSGAKVTPARSVIFYYYSILSSLYNFSDAKLVVATSRPETMFGDVAIAVNPDDPINHQFIGKSVLNPINGKPLPVVGDSRVKLDFGTGNEEDEFNAFIINLFQCWSSLA